MNQLFVPGGQNIGASASVLSMNIQHGLVQSPYSPRDSQESSPTPQFKSINSLALSLPHSPTLTSIHDHWKKLQLHSTPKLGGFKQPLYSPLGFCSSGIEPALSWVVFLFYMVSTEVTQCIQLAWSCVLAGMAGKLFLLGLLTKASAYDLIVSR